MKKTIIAAAVAAAAFASGQPATATSTNLIVNGNFASSTYTTNSQFGPVYGGQGVTGWTGGTGYELYFFASTATTSSANTQYDTGLEKLYSVATPPVGGEFVALDGDPTVGGGGSISQTLNNLTVGTNYLVSFYWATGQLQSRNGATTDDVLVTLGNQSQVTATVADASQSSTPWLYEAFTFQAAATTETLTLLNQGSPVGFPPMSMLDGVSMVAVPEPASIVLFGAGFGLVLIAHRRRMRR